MFEMSIQRRSGMDGKGPNCLGRTDIQNDPNCRKLRFQQKYQNFVKINQIKK